MIFLFHVASLLLKLPSSLFLCTRNSAASFFERSKSGITARFVSYMYLRVRARERVRVRVGEFFLKVKA